MSAQINKMCGIELTKEHICIANYNTITNAVENIAIKYIDHSTGKDINDAIKKDFRKLVLELKLTNHEIVCSLQSEYAIIKKILLDNNCPKNEISENIQWELSQQIIGSLDDYAFDFYSYSVFPNPNYQQYISVAYRKKLIEKITQLMLDNKLIPIIADLDIFALINAFEANYPDELAIPSLLVLAQEKKTKLVLTINGDFVDCDFFEHNNLSNAAESYTDNLNATLTQLLNIYPSLAKQPLNIRIAGTLCVQEDFMEQISSVLNNVKLLNPLEKIPIEAQMSAEDIKRFAPQIAIAVGLALRNRDRI